MLPCSFFSIVLLSRLCSSFFFFNDTATTEIYTLSLHDALPISQGTAVHLQAMVHRRRRQAAEAQHAPLVVRIDERLDRVPVEEPPGLGRSHAEGSAQLRPSSSG